MSFNYLVWSLFRPSHSLIFLGLSGLLFRGRFPRTSRLLAWTSLAGLLLGAFAPLGVWLIAPLEERFPPPDDLKTVDGIVVLAGSERVAFSQAYLQAHVNEHSGRLIAAMQLAASFPSATVVHSGRTPFFADRQTGEQTSASDVASEIFRSAGLVPPRLVLEQNSTDTCESAEATWALIKPEREAHWLLVTSAFHIPRAIACFRAVGWDIVPYPTDYRQATGRGFSAWNLNALGNLHTLDLAAHEWIGLVYYRLAGRTDELFPKPPSRDME